MLTPRNLEVIKTEGYEIDNHNYKLAIVVDGTVEFVMGCNELLARVLATPHTTVFIEENQLSVGDQYTTP
jgi:hypothetical protein